MNITTVRTMADVERVGQIMRSAAMRDFVTSNPVYSKDEAEAISNALPFIKEIEKDDAVQAFVFPEPGTRGTLISVILTVDAFEEQKRWHLSMVRPSPPAKFGGQTSFKRVPDFMASGIAKIILPEGTEGPTEGGIKESRHWFAPYVAP